MSTFEIYATAGVLVFLVGLFRLITGTHLLRTMLALHVMGSGALIVLLAAAYRDRDPAPDPVPQAMALTGIVVMMSVTAFAIALVRRLHAATGHEYIIDLSVAEGAEAPPANSNSDAPDRAGARDG